MQAKRKNLPPFKIFWVTYSVTVSNLMRGFHYIIPWILMQLTITTIIFYQFENKTIISPGPLLVYLFSQRGIEFIDYNTIHFHLLAYAAILFINSIVLVLWCQLIIRGTEPSLVGSETIERAIKFGVFLASTGIIWSFCEATIVDFTRSPPTINFIYEVVPPLGDLAPDRFSTAIYLYAAALVLAHPLLDRIKVTLAFIAIGASNYGLLSGWHLVKTHYYRLVISSFLVWLPVNAITYLIIYEYIKISREYESLLSFQIINTFVFCIRNIVGTSFLCTLYMFFSEEDELKE